MPMAMTLCDGYPIVDFNIQFRISTPVAFSVGALHIYLHFLMKCTSIIMAILISGTLVGQEYTMMGSESYEQGNVAGQVLVFPVHPFRIISEVDRALLENDDDIERLREKLIRNLSMALTRALDDSISTIDLYLDQQQEINVLEYVYNGLTFQYNDMPAEERRGLSKLTSRLQKKDEQAYGAYSNSQEGQLKRHQVLNDRYMSAEVDNLGMVDYMKEVYGFESILVITQMDLVRNHDQNVKGDYRLSIHFSVIDDQARTLSGSRIDSYVDRADLSVENLKSNIFDTWAATILPMVLSVAEPMKVEALSVEQDDY